MIVAIDGPAGAGKSTVARLVARRLGAGYLDTGAMYRAITWLVLDRGVDPADGAACTELAHAHPVTLRPGGAVLRVCVADREVTEPIREPRVSAVVSVVAAHPGVRAAVTDASRVLMATGDWVADGRDVGTNIATHAALKVFLTAHPAERARRRVAELLARGERADPAAVEAGIRERDHLDSTRAEHPLRPADDAVQVDSSDMTIDEVVQRIAELAEDAR